MSEEQQWINRLIDGFDESIRKASWQFNELESCRAEVKFAWDDSCSRELAQRFFDPHAEEATRTLADLRNGEQKLRAAHEALGAVDEAFDKAGKYSRRHQEILSEASTAFHAIDSLLSETHDRVSNSYRHQGDAMNLIQQANQAGNAAPYRG